MTPDASPNGSWFSPDNVFRFIKTAGFPYTLLVALLIFVLSFITGLLPTPLMNALDVIIDVHADQEGVKTVMQESLKVQIATCELIAKDKDEAKKCHPSP